MKKCKWSDAQFVALNLPELPDPLTANGVTISVKDFIEGWLASAGNKYAALHIIFVWFCDKKHPNSFREYCGETKFREKTGMGFWQASVFWSYQYIKEGWEKGGRPRKVKP